MAAAGLSAWPTAAPSGDRDQFVLMHGVSWDTYCALRELIDTPGVRLTYLEGALEIMSPSRSHEDVKKRLARLIELFAVERDVPLYGYGSTTFRKQARERGLEADECYTRRRPLEEHAFPDIAIEVALSGGGLDKLEVYRGLGVREVWIGRDDALRVFLLEASDEYVEQSGSTIVPELDIGALAKFATIEDQHAALKLWRDKLRGS
jgi:Uma2 family endonuclease